MRRGLTWSLSKVGMSEQQAGKRRLTAKISHSAMDRNEAGDVSGGDEQASKPRSHCLADRNSFVLKYGPDLAG